MRWLSVFFVVSCVAMVACFDDGECEPLSPEPPPVPTNYIEVGFLKVVPTSASAYVIQHSDTPQGKLYAAYLSITTEKTDAGLEPTIKPLVRVDLYDLFYLAASASEIPSGEYTFSELPANLTHNGNSEYTLSETLGQWVKLDKNMTIMVRDFGDSLYSVSWNTTDINGTPVSGYYMGKVQF